MTYDEAMALLGSTEQTLIEALEAYISAHESVGDKGRNGAIYAAEETLQLLNGTAPFSRE